MILQESGEMYLETILILSESGNPVRSLDVANYMGYSKPSVSRAVGILKRNNYINVDANGHLSLTDKGKTLADKIYERHVIISKVLESIGVSPETASEDACRIEHVISDESFEALKKSISMNKKKK